MRYPRLPVIAVLSCAILCAIHSATRGQGKLTSPQRFDEFSYLRTDEEQARLDLFAQQLAKDQSQRGFVVGYRLEDSLPGFFLRDLYGYHDYLVNSRGVDPRRIEVIDGGVREKPMIELWLVSGGGRLPITSAATPLDLNGPMEFDSVTLDVGCVGDTLQLQEPRDSLRFFAGVLRENPAAMGFIFVHPSNHQRLGQAEKLADSCKTSLMKEHRVSNRILAGVEARRACGRIDLWLAPSDLVIPKTASVASFFQSQLMAEAEQNQYSVRLVELLGNTYTRDNVIRRRLLQNEGDIFRRKLLEQSLRNLSKLKNFSPVRLQDVEVHLSKNYKEIDFLINLTEQTSSRKRRIQ